MKGRRRRGKFGESGLGGEGRWDARARERESERAAEGGGSVGDEGG